MIRIAMGAGLAGLLLALVACTDDASNLRLERIERRPFETPELVLSLGLSSILREGLERGVALTFRLDLSQGRQTQVFWRELRYLPLTRQYQVREPGTGYSRGYSSRAAALAALERWPLPVLDDAAPVSARLQLDRTRLPAPLVLPALFDGDWRLDSGTVQWPAAPR